MKHHSGFTLLEVMVSAALALVVVVGITEAFMTQNATYVVVDQVSEAQQNLRAVSELIERDVRRAGYMVPSHAAVCGHDQTTGADMLFVSNTDAIRTVFALEGANEDLSGNYGSPVSGANSTFNANGNGFALTLARLWVDVAADGTDFAAGEGVIVVNRNNAAGPVACGKIDTVAGTTVTADLESTSTEAVGSNPDVVAIPAHVYELVPGTPNQLRRNGILLASDVEDFQVTYFFDQDDDLVVDSTGEAFSDAGQTARPFELTPATNRPDPSSLREVGINIVTVTREDDPNVDYQLGAGQATGNRTSGSLASGDGKRRRVSSVRVRIRNAK